MSRYTALFSLLIASIVLAFNLVFPKQSLAAPKEYQCDPPASTFGLGNCATSIRSPVDCWDLDTGTIVQETNGQTCANRLATYYSQQERKTITGTCVDKCTAFSLLRICSRDAKNACTQSLCPDYSFCVNYIYPTPTPTRTPTPTPTPNSKIGF